MLCLIHPRRRFSTPPSRSLGLIVIARVMDHHALRRWQSGRNTRSQSSGTSRASSSSSFSSLLAPSSPGSGNRLNMSESGVSVGHLLCSAKWIRMSPISYIHHVCHFETGMPMSPVIFDMWALLFLFVGPWWSLLCLVHCSLSWFCFCWSSTNWS